MAQSRLEQYPTLQHPIHWGVVTAQFDFSLRPAPQTPIANVSIVPFVGDRVVVVVMPGGLYEMPGGTLEPGEHYLETMQRELYEEAGAELRSEFTVFGGWHCITSAKTPYRPHLPYPRFARLVGYATVEIVANPTNPPDAEQVERVEIMPLKKAIKHFQAQNRHDFAEIYTLAATLRQA